MVSITMNQVILSLYYRPTPLTTPIKTMLRKFEKSEVIPTILCPMITSHQYRTYPVTWIIRVLSFLSGWIEDWMLGKWFLSPMQSVAVARISKGIKSQGHVWQRVSALGAQGWGRGIFGKWGLACGGKTQGRDHDLRGMKINRDLIAVNRLTWMWLNRPSLRHMGRWLSGIWTEQDCCMVCYGKCRVVVDG